VVRNTVLLPGATSAAGILVSSDGTVGERGAMTVTSSLLENNQGTGISVQGADLVFESSEASRGQPCGKDGLFGRGMQVQADSSVTPALPGTATVHGSVFHDNFEEGIMIAGGTATLDHVVVTGTQKGAVSGLLGDGIAVYDLDPGTPTSAQVSSAQLSGNARAGIAAFGTPVSVLDASIQCNGFDLSADAVSGQSASFDDQGGNQCGCDGASKPCVALSANLAPPNVPPHVPVSF
jgi:hypothetical protein